MIESVNNEKIKQYAKLNNKKYRDEMNLFIIEGEHLVEEAKKLGLVEQIYAQYPYEDATIVSEQVMAKLSNLSTPPKVLAICHKRESKPIEGNIIVLDGIQDPGNLGTIIRSCVAFGYSMIVVSPDTVDEYNIKVLRATEGMFFKINFIRTDLEKFINDLHGYTIYTTDVKNGINIRDISIDKPYVLIMGNEGKGVRPNISNLATKKINIPINSNCESLNVAIATTIIMYEFTK